MSSKVSVDVELDNVNQVLKFLEENGFEYKTKLTYVKKDIKVVPIIHSVWSPGRIIISRPRHEPRSAPKNPQDST
jgi:hypothetical protein